MIEQAFASIRAGGSLIWLSNESFLRLLGLLAWCPARFPGLFGSPGNRQEPGELRDGLHRIEHAVNSTADSSKTRQDRNCDLSLVDVN